MFSLPAFSTLQIVWNPTLFVSEKRNNFCCVAWLVLPGESRIHLQHSWPDPFMLGISYKMHEQSDNTNHTLLYKTQRVLFSCGSSPIHHRLSCPALSDPRFANPTFHLVYADFYSELGVLTLWKFDWICICCPDKTAQWMRMPPPPSWKHITSRTWK